MVSIFDVFIISTYHSNIDFAELTMLSKYIVDMNKEFRKIAFKGSNYIL